MFRRRFSPNFTPRLRFQEVLVLAFDASPSMSDQFRLPGTGAISRTTRVGGLHHVVPTFLTQKAAASRWIQVAIVGFSGQAWQHLPWTPLSELPKVQAAVQSFRLAGSGTNVASALQMSLDLIDGFRVPAGTRKDGKIILITDGAANIETYKHNSLLDRAAAAHIRISPIALHNLKDDPSTYDRDFLTTAARRTGGRFMSAHTLELLRHALLRA